VFREALIDPEVENELAVHVDARAVVAVRPELVDALLEVQCAGPANRKGVGANSGRAFSFINT
jgi:hypothetical protein